MKFQISIFLSLVLVFCSFFSVQAQQQIRAPELVGGKSWLNTDQPLSLAALKGKIVLLDFWTYGCINCIHILPDLRRLEEKYPNQLVIIGVHSAKFDNEGETENIRKIIVRYDIEHPVVNDADFKIWNAYKIIAYPGLVLINPRGEIVNRWFGEGQFDEIGAEIEKLVSDFRTRGELREYPLKFALEKAKIGDLPLAFPGKVLADGKSNRLFISDTNHNRIVITDLKGKLLDVIGNGKENLSDGNFQTAAFNRPQGLALDGENLYVADTANHSIRRVNLKLKIVETVSGNGKQAEFRTKGGGIKTSLSSPWDLVKDGNSLFVAMAGTHQIWRIDFDKQTAQPFAGTGAEARLDGRLGLSAFGQPSGIVSDGKNFYVADSETNVIRRINLQKQTVETLAGGDLFIFGDQDGEGDEVRFQHPLGVEMYEGKVLIADTYNHKIKILDPKNDTVNTFLGNGNSGQIDGKQPTFYEPAGLSVANDNLYIADTNNHAVRIVDLKTKLVSTLKIEGLAPPNSDESEIIEPNLSVIKFPKQEISAKNENSLIINLKFPNGFHLNQNAPNRYEITTEKSDTIKIKNARQKFNSIPLTVSFSTLKKGETILKAKINVYYCREDNTGVCLIKTIQWEIPLRITDKNNTTKQIELKETLRLD